MQVNVKTLLSRGVEFIGPEKGLLACGYEGIGWLWNVDGIVKRIQRSSDRVATPDEVKGDMPR